MKPSDYLKRICAVVLALTMLSGIVSANLVGVVLAEPDTEPVETSAPETEAPEAEAPETEAPETEAPETEAPAADTVSFTLGSAAAVAGDFVEVEITVNGTAAAQSFRKIGVCFFKTV